MNSSGEEWMGSSSSNRWRSSSKMSKRSTSASSFKPRSESVVSILVITVSSRSIAFSCSSTVSDITSGLEVSSSKSPWRRYVLLDDCGATEIGAADFRSDSIDVSGQGDPLRI